MSLIKDNGRAGWWGAFAGVIVFALVALPLSNAIAYATHPASQKLFGEALNEISRNGFVAFWWLVVILLGSLPFLVGFGIAKAGPKGLLIIGVIIALLVIAVLVLAQLFAY
jgi:hypothetical protein